jgi:hypothetical protein
MPVSQSQRLRKAAAKAAKRRVVAAEKLAQDRRELNISKPRHIDLATSPIVACMATEDFESKGMATVTVVRKLSLGRYGLVMFLLDTFCLGVKDAFFRVADADQYEIYRNGLAVAGGTASIEPARARKLVRDAADFGAANGFPPPADFAEFERIFGDVAPSEETFTFGRDGKPYYVAGPYESAQRSEYVRKMLEQRFGPGGFHFTIPLDLFDDEDYEGDVIEGEAVEIEAIAATDEAGNSRAA